MQRTIIGQDRLLDRVDSLVLKDIPHTILINGLCSGSGEHLVAEYIASHLGLASDDITEKLSAELIDEIYIKPEPYVYIIDTVKLSIKDQNVILKFIEEPLMNAYVMLLCDNIYDLIPTVVNRCVVWTLDSYKPSDLMGFTDRVEGDVIFDIAHTPGQVIEYSTYDIDEMIKRASYIIENIARASFSNILKLIGDVAFKDDDKDKFNLDAWVNVLEYSTSNKLMKELSIEDSFKLQNALKLTIELGRNIRRVGIDKQALYYQYLINLWKTLRGEND